MVHLATKHIKQNEISKVHLCSVDPQKLCGVHVAINYTPFSMAYYTYDSIANCLSLRSIYTCISKERRRKEELHNIGNFEVTG